MATSSNICATCLRTARLIVSKPVFRVAGNNTSRAYSRAITATASRGLYLDFLAPSAARYSTKAHRLPSSSILRTVQCRTLATTSDPSAARPAHAVQNPRNDDSGSPMTISISPRASNRLHAISTGDKNPNLALRVAIESGGCHGFQYLMDLTDLDKSPATEEDTVFEGEKGEKVVIDESSLELLNGSTVDYTMELIGSQFKVTGIPGATSSCGCGTSFDIKL